MPRRSAPIRQKESDRRRARALARARAGGVCLCGRCVSVTLCITYTAYIYTCMLCIYIYKLRTCTIHRRMRGISCCWKSKGMRPRETLDTPAITHTATHM